MRASGGGFVTDANGRDGTTLAYAPRIAAALTSWGGINVVRIPLNEDCWLGINGANPAYSGGAYQQFIRAEVAALSARGIATILDLHWSAPGSWPADRQDVAPNVEHSVPFWQQVATMFRGDRSGMFDLFNEPRLSCYSAACRDYATRVRFEGSCYRDGCRYTYSSGDGTGRTGSFDIAGTQRLVNVIRSTGAQNVIIVEGLGWANSLWQWTQYRPGDPARQLAAEVHVYTSSGAKTPTSLDGMLATGGLSAGYPIIVGEFGEAICPTNTGFARSILDWATARGYAYTAWGWDAGEGCGGPSLVTNNDTGAPTAYGAVVRNHLRGG
jgi:hypothetical protein